MKLLLDYIEFHQPCTVHRWTKASKFELVSLEFSSTILNMERKTVFSMNTSEAMEQAAKNAVDSSIVHSFKHNHGQHQSSASAHI